MSDEIFILPPNEAMEMRCKPREDADQDAADIRLVLRALEVVCEELLPTALKNMEERLGFVGPDGVECAYSRLKARYGGGE